MDFVLVHGTTQAPSGWDRLVAALSERGHHAHCLDLAEVPADAPATAYARHATRWWADRARAPVVVAHSGSGALLPALAQALDASHQVWLAAYVPDFDGGACLLEDVGGDPAATVNQEWLGQDPSTDPVLAAYFLFHDCDLATLRWALGTVRPFRAEAVYQHRPTADPRAIPSTYLLPVEDRTLRPDWMRRAAHERLGAACVELLGGHCPHVARPERVADVLSGVRD
ncbi:Alpha/beta hydrolase family protein [Streptoalloteichus tenebrarius]|uniref:Alpha/beta hydrolase family protein n=1 Tax=Streptoalloteichus tenebrarius (strain ATCC 17920 / DSM 40477 / JCM 4838 / CBS 697.72 / NBRC 16177 / NCIMB 11028 / NRRL B-12390 / A12253. 1 / ISP 5477) TaxID=1933 RepID=A0ABT1HX67_STRSD|nr:alpha/beta hydrolase [Streptoalloteichus tenebrarius]MCP2260108.1 Alpha/beta hydrolase family protein [Streptoalloteichus tenebrarius]